MSQTRETQKDSERSSPDKVKILILSKDGKVSEQMDARLEVLRKKLSHTSDKYQFDYLKEESDAQLTASQISKENYDIVMIDENITLSAWDIIDRLSQNPNEKKPVFYLGGNIEKLIDKECRLANFSGALEITKESQPLFRFAYREANRFTDKKISNDATKTKFNIGSIGKMITAIATCKMVEEYHLDFHKPIRNFLPPDYPHKDIFKDFTLHELLTHTSGLEGGAQESFFKTRMISFHHFEEYLPWINRPELLDDLKIDERRKNKEHVYSNPGFFLLGFAIEAITGKEYYDYIKTNVFKPSGMVNTFFDKDNLDSTFAVPYTKKPNHSLTDEITWLEKAIPDEKNEDIKNYLIQAQDLVYITQKCINETHGKIDELIRIYEKSIATIHDKEEFMKFKNDFSKKIEMLYDSVSKYEEIADTVRDTHKKVFEWIKTNEKDSSLVDSINTAKKLEKLFQRDELFSDLTWPLKSIHGFINTLSPAHPAGCWFSTLDDLLAFDRALWNPNGALNKYAHILIQPEEVKKHGYGYGIGVRGTGEKVAMGHFGGAPGSRSSLYTFPARQMTVVTLSNDESLEMRMPVAIEEKLVFGVDSGIKYFDKRINANPNELLIQDIENAANNKSKSQYTSTHASLYALLPKSKDKHMPKIETLKAKLKKLFDEDEKERAIFSSKFEKIDEKSFDQENKKLALQDMTRRHKATEIMALLKEPSAEDYYYAAIIFQHGDSVEDYKRANFYATKSCELGDFKPDHPGMCDNRYLYATT